MSAPSTAADPTAVIGRRIVAYVIDTIMVWAIGAVLVLVLAEDTSPNDDSFDFVVEGGDALVLYLIVGVYALMTQVLQQGLTGATPGKLIAGVRCVKGDGSAPGILRALLRTLLLVIDAGFCYLPGLILAVVTKKHQRLGDLAASTYVVGAGSAGQPVDAPAGAQQADWTDPQWTAQPAATTGDQWGAWSSSPTGGTDQGANAWGQQPAEQQSPAAPAWGQQPAEQQSPAAPAWGQQPAEQQSPATPAWGRASEPEQQSPAAPAWGQQPAEQQSPAAPAWGRASEPEQPAEASDQTWIPSSGRSDDGGATDERTEAHAAVGETAASAKGGEPAYAPQWDADRQAYIQWDPSGRRWMQWDQTNQRWFPIS